jgi:transposase, IS30 family
MTSQRPVETANRVVAGHWEGDLIVGKANRSFVATLVERSARFPVLLHLPSDPSDDQVIAALAAKTGPAAGPAAPLGHLGPEHRDGRPA